MGIGFSVVTQISFRGQCRANRVTQGWEQVSISPEIVPIRMPSEIMPISMLPQIVPIRISAEMLPIRIISEIEFIRASSERVSIRMASEMVPIRIETVAGIDIFSGQLPVWGLGLGGGPYAGEVARILGHGFLLFLYAPSSRMSDEV